MQFKQQIFERTKIYQNYQFILNKAENDGYLQMIYNVINRILSREMQYALDELSKIKQKNDYIDVKTLFTKNILIFKENLGLVLANSLNLLWKLKMDSVNINQYMTTKFGSQNGQL